jgi:penicillin-binding protein 2
VYGKQTTSWFATYTKDYSIVMTISQGGTGSGASGPAVRNIYNALYGVSEDGEIDKKKALLPTPQKTLPEVRTDGTIKSPKVSKDPAKDRATPSPDARATTPQDGDPADPQEVGTVPSPENTNRDTRRRERRRGGGPRRGDGSPRRRAGHRRARTGTRRTTS